MLYKPDPTPEQAERLFYTRALKSNGCQCGLHKQPGRALCYKCWIRLPGEMRRSLYQRLGSGFEQAYEGACKFLND